MSDPVFIHDLPVTEDATAIGAYITLTGAEAKHTQVKRLKNGETLIVTNGSDRAIRGTWVDGSIEITEHLTIPAPRPTVTVVQALPKSDRAELAVDLLVQAGVDCIVPWAADRCIARWDGKEAKAHAKWDTAARAAAKQSRRLVVPPVTDLLRNLTDLFPLISDAMSRPVDETNTAVGVLHEEAAQPLTSLNLDAAHVVLVIGPEGGVSPAEIEALEAAGAQAVVLGPEVLRTATAGAVALGAIGALTPRWA